MGLLFELPSTAAAAVSPLQGYSMQGLASIYPPSSFGAIYMPSLVRSIDHMTSWISSVPPSWGKVSVKHTRMTLQTQHIVHIDRCRTSFFGNHQHRSINTLPATKVSIRNW